MRAPVSPVTDRRSSASIGGRRHGKTPDRWDFSRTTTSSGDGTNSSSSSSIRSTLWVVGKAFGSCLGKQPQQQQQQQQPADYSPSSSSSSAKRSGKGMMMMMNATGNSNSNSNSSGSRRLSININRSAQIGDVSFFSMRDIRKATKNFSPALKIGQGGFGTVYRGTLGDGTVVAVKRAKKSVYDNHLGQEFQSEIQTLARVEHLNLVKFLGYLECEDERIVVVEYVPNGTLREHLDGVHGGHLDVGARLDIAIDVAHAVTYLHTYTDHPIIHRDIKSSNILLTENLRAKVADFGFARLGATEPGVTHVSTQVKGTAGYLDPEYLRTYQLTEKSDVYSFGVLLVELISGRRPIESKRDIRERITPKWAMKKFMDGNAIHILDSNLPQNPATNLALEKILELALHCLAPTRQGRPSMQRCAEILWSIRKDYRELLASDALGNPSRQREPSLMEEDMS